MTQEKEIKKIDDISRNVIISCMNTISSIRNQGSSDDIHTNFLYNVMSDVLTKEEYKWFCNSFQEYYFTTDGYLDLRLLYHSLLNRGMSKKSINILYKNLNDEIELELFETLDINEIKVLIQDGVDINAQDEDNSNLTILHRACIKNDLELVKFLIENGADLTIKDADGGTALDIAKNKNFQDIVDYLETLL